VRPELEAAADAIRVKHVNPDLSNCADLSGLPGIERIASKGQASLGRSDILVNNAGSNRIGGIFEFRNEP
jgi:NAD(P)-dependent dehydrogenase (short-subunit alcohol dehydrogenase family)